MTPDELTRLREVAVSREAWRRKADGLREEVARLRAAIAPTAANVEALAEVLWRHREGLSGHSVRAILRAINKRAKL